jgi:prepilin-type N-terminal cleavage/methylation domain-containing protein
MIKRPSSSGLTLVEVLLAMAVLSIAGISLISAMGQAVAVVRSARLYNHSHTLINRVQLENPLFDEDIDVGRESGVYQDVRLGAFNWTREISLVGEEEDRLFEVRIRISWAVRGQSSYEEVVFYRHVPEES